MKIKQDEIELVGKWIQTESSLEKDETCLRIERLISDYLIKTANGNSGWEKLYQDPEDNRYWELTYPESEMHGGGAPTLRNLSDIEVIKKYTFK